MTEISSTLPLFFKKMHKIKMEALGENNISKAQMELLWYLRHHGKSKMSELGKVLMVSKPNITSLVDKLEESGIISREADPDDRRATYIYITDKGNVEIEKYREKMREIMRKKLELMTEEEIEIMLELTQVMKKFINNKNI